MKEILLAQGEVAVVDDEDYSRLSKYKWCCRSDGYVVRSTRVKGKSKTLYMHREILQTPEGMDTDHINHNKLDNQKTNLRACTRAQNLYNQKQKQNISGYKGVERVGQRWRAAIGIDGKYVRLGCFLNKEDAARAYDHAARGLFGEFASTNF